MEIKYLVIDASLSGTGIRDYYNGGYMNIEDLGISPKIIKQLNTWLLKYENEHFNGFENNEIIDKLDKEGKEIAIKIKKELIETKIAYFSSAKMLKEVI